MPIAFQQVGIFKGAVGGPNVLSGPTSLQFGPDGRLYVSEQNGSINAFTVELQGGAYVATAHELLTDASGDEVVKSIQNHTDHGAPRVDGNRQVTGIAVGGTAEAPVLYIGSSDPDISTNNDAFLDTNSGVITRAAWDPAAGAWDVVDLVRGLPRSEENHSNNGMVLSADGTKLFVQVGGNTNNGAPSKFFAYTNEYALSGTLLELDLTALDALPTRTDPAGGQGGAPRQYKYDLPTLDDPNTPNVTDGVGEDANGMDEAGPWGGNDGLNMAILPADAPLRIYADGFRNAYDVARAGDGALYTVDNGSNGNLGGFPNTEAGDADGDGVPGEAVATPNNGGPGDAEPLFRIEEGGYYQHANPVRSNQNMAWTVYDDDGNPDASLSVNTVADISALVPDGVDIPDGYIIAPSRFATGPGETLADLSDAARAARLLLSGQGQDRDKSSLPIAIVGSSTNGIMVYDSGGTAFDGVLDGKLFVTQFNDNVTLLNINAAGDALLPVMAEGPDGQFGTADDVVQAGGADGVLEVANNALGIALANPLDVTMGPNGTLWVAEIGSGEITVLAPTDVVLPGDTDSDDDGIPNAADPFMRDATNGAAVVVAPGQAYLWDFDANQDGNLPGPAGFGGGLTGVMVNGETDFEAFFQSDAARPGQVIELDNVKFTTAAGGGTTVIEYVSNGDPFKAVNSGAFLFQTGVTLAPNVATATFEWSMFNPASDPNQPITGTFQQIGGQIGTGDQSNYLKIVAIQTGSGPKIQVALENDDVVVASQDIDTPAGSPTVFDAQSIPSGARIFLRLDVDVLAGTAVPSATYETASGDVTVTGAAIDLSGTAVLEAVRGQHEVQGQSSGLAVGLFSSNTGEPAASAFQAIFDDITITATEAQVGPEAGDDAVSTGVGQTVTIPVAALLANDVDLNGDALTITSVGAAANGTVALDDGGTPGDSADDAVVFTPDAGFEGTATFEYAVSDGTATDVALVTVNVADTTVLYRVNAGGAAIAALANDPYGSDLAWAANTGNGAQSGDGFSNNTGQAAGFAVQGRATGGDNAVPDYVPQALFTTERYDLSAAPQMTYAFGEGGLAAGRYTVNLFMANGFGGTDAAGERVFDIAIEGAAAFEGVDLSGTLGHQVGGMFTWTGQVTDGTLDIEWLHDVENPLVNAIEVLGPARAPDPTLSVSIVSGATQAVAEGAGSVQISLLTSETVPAGQTVDVVIEIQGVTATPGAGGDFAYAGGGTFGGGTYTDTVSIVGGSSDVTIPIAILDDAEVEAGEAFAVRIVSVSGNATVGAVAEATVTILDDDGDAGAVLYRVNAGGPKVVVGADDAAAPNDPDLDWGADTGAFGQAGNSPYLAATSTGTSTYDNNAGSSHAGDASTTDPSIPAGTPGAIFNTERYDPSAAAPNMAWSFDVASDHGLQPGDRVEVRLYFAEIFNGVTAAGQRVFDVSVDGAVPTAFDDVDPVAAAGTNAGFMRAAVVTVDADGILDLEFLRGVENPALKGIEIVAVNGDAYVPPADSLFGASIEISDDRLAPTDGGVLDQGAHVVTATQEGPNGDNGVRDRDYFTFEVPQGKVLTGIFLDGYANANPGSPDGFLAIQRGGAVTVDPATGQPDAGGDGLLGAVVYGSGDVGENLLARMAQGGTVDPSTGFSLAPFDPDLTGRVAVWLNQGAGPGTPTLRFVVDDDPDAGVPGAYLPNANGNFVFEAEDAADKAPGNWVFKTTDDLPGNHEAPSNGGYVEATTNHLNNTGGETLTYLFTPEVDGFVRVNLIASRNSGSNPDSATDHNDSYVGISQGGTLLVPLDQGGVELDDTGGYYKAFSSGGSGNQFIVANKNVDNVGKAIVYAVEAGQTYQFELKERSAGHEVDKIVLETLTNGNVGPNNNAAALKGQPPSPRVEVPPRGEAVLTINAGSNDIEVSNYGADSFSITNTGTKDIGFFEIDVTDAILPDAVFDPFGVAGDTVGRSVTLPGGSDGGTGLVVPAGGFGPGSAGITFLGAGGVQGFERIRLEFTDFNPGETITFGVDMDPNSIAGAQKGTLDSGAALAGAGLWDVGGVSGAELIGSTFTVGYADQTTATAQLMGNGPGSQSGATAVASQAPTGGAVALAVNGVAPGGEGDYGPDGPTVTVQGPVGATARIVLAKGFVVPFENNFPDDPNDPDEYHDQLDAQLAALAASGFPANNVVEFQYVDVTLDGTVQDVTALFDFTDVDAFDLSAVGLDEATLPLGFAAGVIDPATGLPAGPVTSPIHLTFAANAAPEVVDPGAQAVDEGGAFSLQIAATDPEGDVPLSYALEVLGADGAPLADAPFAIDAATGLITGTAPLVAADTVLTARVTVTDAAGSASVLDVPISVADTLADADLSLTKTVSDATPAFGDTVTFEVVVSNAGGDGAAGVVVEDLLPNGYALTGTAASAGTYDVQTGLWTVGAVAAGGSETLTLTATVLAGAAADVPVYRVNANGSAQAAGDGSSPGWTTLAGTAGVVKTGGTAFGNNNTIGGSGVPDDVDLSQVAGTPATQSIFRTEYYGDQQWDFAVDPGDYVVNLYFAEIFVGVQNNAGVGGRVFDVAIEGQTVLDDYDIFAAAGGGRIGVVESFAVTSDATLDIDFTTVVDNAKISAIEVIRVGTPATATYDAFAQIVAADVADPDSTPGNGPSGEDDEAAVAVDASAAGANVVSVALAADGDAAEPADDGQFVVTLEQAAATDTVVTYAVGGTATAGADYAALTGTVTIAAGATSAAIDLSVLDDAAVEDAETVTVTLTGVAGDAGVALGAALEATATIADDDVPPVTGSAVVTVTPGAALGASTFGGSGAFTITNLAGADIVGVTIDLGTGLLPDMVFDPTGAGGDATAQGFTPNASQAAATGLVPFGDPDADPFSGARNGGFDAITLAFTDFGAGESFSFGVDVDPNSIQGVAGAGAAGGVSGYELTGATVTVTFGDGTSQAVAVGSLFEDGSLGGGQAVVGTAPTPAAPTLALVGAGGDESSLPGAQHSVALGASDQQVRVTGAPGATVTLLQMDARLWIASGDDPFDVGADELPFYANEALAGKALYTAQLGADGEAVIDVSLLATATGDAGPDGGLNHFVAVLSDGPYAPGQPISRVSETLVVRQAEVANTPPVITTADAFEVAEGATGPVFVAAATDAESDPLTFTLGGADADAFVFDAATGAVAFAQPPAYAAGGDNDYALTLSVSDGRATDALEIAVSVLLDSDGDLVADKYDNATFVANADQRDSDGDGYGNVVDADFNGDGTVGVLDLVALRAVFGDEAPITAADPGLDEDLNGDGTVGVLDLVMFQSLFGQPPGPSYIDEI